LPRWAFERLLLEAARACLQEHGLEAVSMEMIIARSGLSTGAVYGYFKGKDELINAVVTEGTAAMGRRLVPILRDPEPPALPELVDRLLGTIAEFGEDERDGVDRLLVSLHGWSHSQSNPELRELTRVAYRRQRELFAEVVRRWQAAGTFDPGADPGRDGGAAADDGHRTGAAEESSTKLPRARPGCRRAARACEFVHKRFRGDVV
jgi:AcrR family transcriptional regulator